MNFRQRPNQLTIQRWEFSRLPDWQALIFSDGPDQERYDQAR
jgi:hypothetical protein